jgi:hypothetical protein
MVRESRDISDERLDQMMTDWLVRLGQRRRTH